MRHIDMNKILSDQEKERVAERIQVFYDKERKYKRHADGLTLIKEIVQPLTSTKRLGKLSPKVKESLERVIQESYSP